MRHTEVSASVVALTTTKAINTKRNEGVNTMKTNTTQNAGANGMKSTTTKNAVASFIADIKNRSVTVHPAAGLDVNEREFAAVVAKDEKVVVATEASMRSYLSSLGWAIKKGLLQRQRERLSDVALTFVARCKMAKTREEHAAAVSQLKDKLYLMTVNAEKNEAEYEKHREIIMQHGSDISFNTLSVPKDVPYAKDDEDEYQDAMDYVDYDSDLYEEEREYHAAEDLIDFMEQAELRYHSEKGGFKDDLEKTVYEEVSAEDWVAYYMDKDFAYWTEQAHYQVFRVCDQVWPVEYAKESVAIDTLLSDHEGNVKFGKTNYGNMKKVRNKLLALRGRLLGLEKREEFLITRLHDDEDTSRSMYDRRQQQMVSDISIAAMQDAKTQDDLHEVRKMIQEAEIILSRLSDLEEKYLKLKQFVQFDDPVANYTHYFAFDPIEFMATMVQVKTRHAGSFITMGAAKREALKEMRKLLPDGTELEFDSFTVPSKVNAETGEIVELTLHSVGVHGTDNDDELANFAYAMSGLSYRQRVYTNADAKGAALKAQLEVASKSTAKVTVGGFDAITERAEDIIFG